MRTDFLFTSERLGFRNWTAEDIPLMAAINADREVMHFFPATQSAQQTADFVARMQKSYHDNGFCYFAVDTLVDGAFIGFIGLAVQTFQASFTPCVDIGWRLAKKNWNRGYATEGAKRCMQYGFNELNLQKILALAPKINTPSERVMKKTGMKKVSEFLHPMLLDNNRLKECVLYEITRHAVADTNSQ